ncbi:MAG: hypothetical protein JST00_32640 [Deltaproteobacteria bacterium]|nr:hypothetical protein [Deltaproteobacteria bacterium]
MRPVSKIAAVAAFITCGAVTAPAQSGPEPSHGPEHREGWGSIRQGSCRTYEQWCEWATLRCANNPSERVMKEVFPISGTQCFGGQAGAATGWTGIDYRCEAR